MSNVVVCYSFNRFAMYANSSPAHLIESHRQGFESSRNLANAMKNANEIILQFNFTFYLNNMTVCEVGKFKNGLSHILLPTILDIVRDIYECDRQNLRSNDEILPDWDQMISNYKARFQPALE